MKVFYSELNQEVNAKLPIVALIRNNHWFLWGIEEKSRYFGYWIKNKDRIFKLIDSFEISGLSQFDTIKKIEIISPYFSRIFFNGNVLEILLDSQGIILKTNKPLKIKINFDFKKLYSRQNFGNNYQILPLSKGYYINFFQENEKYNIETYLFYNGDLKIRNFWKETYNNFDKKRNSEYKSWVYEAIEGYFTEIKFFCPEKPVSTIPLEQNYNSRNNAHFDFLMKRILALYDDYFLAGLPWFCEYWFRDELISLWLLNDSYKRNVVFSNIKDKMLKHYLENLENFALSNKPCGDNSADILLWIIFLLNKKEFESNEEKIKSVFRNWLDVYFKNGKIILPEKSTWMDTINRPRALEVDFLFMKAIEKIHLDGLLETYIKKLKTSLITEFYPKEELERPNVFMAYLIEQGIVSPKKWERLFDNLIAKNWCNWGGFGTLSKNNSDFKKFHSGEKTDSYHKGDSWFWLNNIAAIAMDKLQTRMRADLDDDNYKKYSKYIDAIKSSGLKNLLEFGALGWGSELSSFSELKSEGSPIQLWSMSSLAKFTEL